MRKKKRTKIHNIWYYLQKTQASINVITFVLVRGACTRESSTLNSIIQNMLTYYIKYRPNIDPLKPKVMKLIYTKKKLHQWYNYTLCTLYFFKQKLQWTKSIKWWKIWHFILNLYDQPQLLVINEIFLVGKRMLSFVDHRL
jgi:hypothetical protein